MADFPRTQIENVSVSRLIVGTNWFMGFSHTSKSKDVFIKEHQTRQRIAEILKVFFEAGCDAVMGVRPDATHLTEAIRDAEQATGRKAVMIYTPTMPTDPSAPGAVDEVAKILDRAVAKDFGATFCMPHMATTDAMVNIRTRKIEGMDVWCKMIRDRGMLPGLSTHMPESPVYADESGLDVASYIQIYNAAGFLMHIEVDWVQRMIWKAKKPVMTIKPLAAGRLMPLVGLAFSWSTIRDIDMVALGAMTADEAKEGIDISLSVLNRTPPAVPLQYTRSKAT
ncbi:MAG: hypothetical protein FWD53_05370, partial [Phycisphaerales bacterium]|nr:hypothetical protein [Phycisphaerales bacterium]